MCNSRFQITLTPWWFQRWICRDSGVVLRVHTFSRHARVGRCATLSTSDTLVWKQKVTVAELLFQCSNMFWSSENQPASDPWWNPFFPESTTQAFGQSHFGEVGPWNTTLFGRGRRGRWKGWTNHGCRYTHMDPAGPCIRSIAATLWCRCAWWIVLVCLQKHARQPLLSLPWGSRAASPLSPGQAHGKVDEDCCALGTANHTCWCRWTKYIYV